VTTTEPQASPLSLAVARGLTEIFAPIVLIVAQLFAVAVHASHSFGRGCSMARSRRLSPAGSPTPSSCSASTAESSATGT
jgi:hypothetical protein